nr:immunoglobulin heavy chain junction region [Macaca mulatta]MOY30041.1 immunoglobulin heavy chain junction region [Macaca mulatta]
CARAAYSLFDYW